THQCLVSGKCKYVDIHLLHVDRNDTRGLRGINDESEVVLATNGTDLTYRLDRPDHVRAMIDNHDLRVRLNRFAYGVWFDKPCAVEWQVSRLRPDVANHVVDRTDHGVVCEVCRYDVVARIDEPGNGQV